jgi:adenylate kinase
MQARNRADDTEDAIAKRLALYERETRPVLDWFADQGLLVTVDGLGSEDEVSARLFETVDAAVAG